ncbi:enterobactin/ferric enterobactin esterase [Thalassoglobus neptunius]|uniref:Enterobactin/ferric enterobactin esterase n=1 Tax=Thalassoglobus neptunius TaxID=1938619 RepID=A0A5C5WXK7_9PLAN|nr:alpha/beta hydrolase-fold protein [Thalassoglobus neptunius]TWT55397.1 enterobactin/ferric enterobactin esterase [Thalassoglobus neptunius]
MKLSNSLCLVAIACFAAVPETTHAAVNSIAEIHQVLHHDELDAATATEIADYIRNRYKGQDLSRGRHRTLIQRTESGGGIALWVLEAPATDNVSVVAEKDRRWQMRRLPETGLWVWTEEFPNFSSVHFRFDVNGKRIGGGREGRFGFESYEWQPESLEQPGTPKGILTKMPSHTGKTYFPGVQRDWWVYVPAQYQPNPNQPAKLIVFNDGGGFIRGEGNACTVLDNLIHLRKIPVMIAVFVNPGKMPGGGSNRGNEYDTCTPRFATFLDEELLPIVREKYTISDDPWDHAICGSSSGASCAFTAAWHRNDLFQRVISFVGSYCDFRGLQDYPQYGDQHLLDGNKFGPWKTAHDYPALIRKTDPRKQIKIFLQDGENDLDNQLGNWFENNQRMASALNYAGYDYWFVAGQGMHSKKHGMSLLPEILVWLWSDSEGQPQQQKAE